MASTVHADSDVVVLKNLSEGDAGKLGDLVGVEDLRLTAAFQRLSDRLDEELRVQGAGDPPGEHLASWPVHDRQTGA